MPTATIDSVATVPFVLLSKRLVTYEPPLRCFPAPARIARRAHSPAPSDGLSPQFRRAKQQRNRTALNERDKSAAAVPGVVPAL